MRKTLRSLACVAALAGVHCGDAIEGHSVSTDEGVSATAAGAIHPQASSGLCLDVIGQSTANGAGVQVWECTGNANQSWSYDGSHLRIYGDKCLDVTGGSTANGTTLQIWDCVADDPNQSWTLSGKTFAWSGESKCLDLTNGAAANGTLVQSWTCYDADANQEWSFGTDTVSSDAGSTSKPGAGDTSAPDAATAATRHVNWYLNRNQTSANATFASANRASMTGVYLCCNAFEFDDSGAFVSSASDADIQAQMAPLAALGLRVSYVLSITDTGLESGAYETSIAEAVDTAVRNHFDGYVSDYEPSTNYTVEHEQQYAAFLAALAAALHAANPRLSLGVDVGDWGILDAWSVYAPVAVDAFTSMNPTYYGTSLSADEAFVTGERSGGIPLGRIAVGVSTTEWSGSDLANFVSWLGQSGVGQIDVWRSDIDSYGAVQPYYFSTLQSFLAAPP
jgi:Ricin-type beta-trefoil lectin domain